MKGSVLREGKLNCFFFPLPHLFLPVFYPSFSASPSVLTSVSLFPAARCQAVQAENVTVLEGGTAQISCRLQNYDGSIVVIQNPRRQTLFFNGTRGVYVCVYRQTYLYQQFKPILLGKFHFSFFFVFAKVLLK